SEFLLRPPVHYRDRHGRRAYRFMRVPSPSRSAGTVHLLKTGLRKKAKSFRLEGSRAHLGTTTKSARKRSAAVCGAPAAAARRGHAFWDHSATLGIRTCCGWSFGHSRGPVVVPRCAPAAFWPLFSIAFVLRPRVGYRANLTN